jgi:hypothetical protein
MQQTVEGVQMLARMSRSTGTLANRGCCNSCANHTERAVIGKRYAGGVLLAASARGPGLQTAKVKQYSAPIDRLSPYMLAVGTSGNPSLDSIKIFEIRRCEYIVIKYIWFDEAASTDPQRGGCSAAAFRHSKQKFLEMFGSWRVLQCPCNEAGTPTCVVFVRWEEYPAPAPAHGGQPGSTPGVARVVFFCGPPENVGLPPGADGLTDPFDGSIKVTGNDTDLSGRPAHLGYAHEIGHALGIVGHRNEGGHLMSPCTRQKPCSDVPVVDVFEMCRVIQALGVCKGRKCCPEGIPYPDEAWDEQQVVGGTTGGGGGPGGPPPPSGGSTGPLQHTEELPPYSGPLYA